MSWTDSNLFEAVDCSQVSSPNFDGNTSTPVYMEDVQREAFRLEDGLDLVVTNNTKSCRYVGTLLLAVNKLKTPLTGCSRELCSTIFKSLVEETIVETTVNICANSRYVRTDSETQCTLCDISQKSIILESGGMKLQAVTLKGGHEDRIVNFNLSKYTTLTSGSGQTVLLSINKYNLSCKMNGNSAELTLEQCSKEELKIINELDETNRFLFLKTTTGTDMSTFESFRCRKWFISTYEGEHLPVHMYQGDTRNKNFRMK